MAIEPRSTEAENRLDRDRVRVGLIGLAFVFLLMMLATALLRVTREDQGIAGNQVIAAANGTAPAPSDALAQLGVAPGAPSAAPEDNDATAAPPSASPSSAASAPAVSPPPPESPGSTAQH